MGGFLCAHDKTTRQWVVLYDKIHHHSDRPARFMLCDLSNRKRAILTEIEQSTIRCYARLGYFDRNDGIRFFAICTGRPHDGYLVVGTERLGGESPDANAWWTEERVRNWPTFFKEATDNVCC